MPVRLSPPLKPALTGWIVIAFLVAGLAPGIAYAQQINTAAGALAPVSEMAAHLDATDQKSPHSAPSPTVSYLSQGILPLPGRNGFDEYFSSDKPQRGLILSLPAWWDGSASNAASTVSGPGKAGGLMWLEATATPTSHNGFAAQLGIGYAPSPDLGFAAGPVLMLNSPLLGTGYGEEDPNDFSVTPTVPPDGWWSPRHEFRAQADPQDSAGLAASLSYMPFEDIWIGIHGRVSKNLNANNDIKNSKDGLLDNIDTMLGLTAGYRLNF